jgi:hypothetical protein
LDKNELLRGLPQCHHHHTFEISRKSAKDLVNVTMRMAHGKKIQIDLFENSTINETFKIRENKSVLAFSETVQAKIKKRVQLFNISSWLNCDVLFIYGTVTAQLTWRYYPVADKELEAVSS